MLKRLYVDNVRCLSNFELQPARVATLVGPNGGGKSSVFEVLRSLQAFLHGGELVDRIAPQGSLTRWDSRRTQWLELDCELDQQSFHYQLEVTHGPDGSATVVHEEQLTADGDLLYRAAGGSVELVADDGDHHPGTRFPFVQNRSFIPLLESRPEYQRLTAFKSWIAGLWLFSLNPWAIQPISEAEGASIAVDGSNFVSWFRNLVQEAPDITAALTADLAPMIPGLQAMRLKTVGQRARVLVFDCQVAGRQVDIAVGELSEGQRILLVLYAILRAVAPRANLLVFDEPDNFVAQAEIQPWLSALRETVADKGRGTLLVISHHPEVIDYLAADEALYLWRTAEGPTRVKNLASDLERSRGLLASEWLKLGGGLDQ